MHAVSKFRFSDICLFHFFGYLKGDNSFGCERFSILDESLATKKVIKIASKALLINHWTPLNLERRSRAT
jgi:hypothetical protein